MSLTNQSNYQGLNSQASLMQAAQQYAGQQLACAGFINLQQPYAASTTTFTYVCSEPEIAGDHGVVTWDGSRHVARWYETEESAATAAREAAKDGQVSHIVKRTHVAEPAAKVTKVK